MKLVKSLLLGSVAGVAAVASAQAADLPFRKAAPVEYVRVCDFTGAGFFYIPGTDTCLKLEGFIRFEYAAIGYSNAYSPAGGATGNFTNTSGGNLSNFTGSGFIPKRVLPLSGFFTRGRFAADARTQTAYGTLRAYVRYEVTRTSGNYNLGGIDGGNFIVPGSGTNISLDKGYIQFAGITAGRVQSFFDFYADNYNFEGIANSDESNVALAYTYTFGGGFSATLSVEDRDARNDGIGNAAAVATVGNTFIVGNGAGASYSGQTIPDVIGVVRVDQAWGAAQLSAAYHDVDTNNTTLTAGGRDFQHAQVDGFAVQGGVQIKLPMLAAGDDLWLQGAYQEGAYLYQDSGSNFSSGFYGIALGGFQHLDVDAVAVLNPNGGYGLAKGSGFSALAAIHHYFTPMFHDVLFGSYEQISYGNIVKNSPWFAGGIGDASEYRIGNQFIFTPVHNLDIGLEFLYAHIDQDIAGTGAGALGGPTARAVNTALYNANVAARGVRQNPDGFEGRFRMERDF